MAEWCYRYADTGPMLFPLAEEQARRVARLDHSVILLRRETPADEWVDVVSPGPDDG